MSGSDDSYYGKINTISKLLVNLNPRSKINRKVSTSMQYSMLGYFGGNSITKNFHEIPGPYGTTVKKFITTYNFSQMVPGTTLIHKIIHITHTYTVDDLL